MFSRLSLHEQAVAMALTAYLLFSTADVSAKILSERYPIDMCLFIPAIIALIGIALRVLFEKGFDGFKTRFLKIHLIRGCIITAMVVLCVNAIKLIPMADFYSVIFLSPFVLMLLSVFLYKEEIHWPRIMTIALSFTGVLITIGPKFEAMNIGYLFIFCAVFFSALNIIFVRKIDKDEYVPLFGLFPCIGVAVFSLPFVAGDLPTLATMPSTDIAIFLVYGLALIGAHSLLPAAFARTPSVSKLTPLHYSQMVWGILAGVFIIGTPTYLNTYLGGALIVGAGLWLFFYEHRAHKKSLTA